MDEGDRLDDLVDHYARQVRAAVRSSISLVTLLDPARHRMLGAGPRTSYDAEFLVLGGRPLVVNDARLVPELAGDPTVPALDVVAYAGWPISRTVPWAPGDVPGKLTSEILGVVCAIDHEPREWSSRDLLALCDLARTCAGDLERYDVAS